LVEAKLIGKMCMRYVEEEEEKSREKRRAENMSLHLKSVDAGTTMPREGSAPSSITARSDLL